MLTTHSELVTDFYLHTAGQVHDDIYLYHSAADFLIPIGQSQFL